MEEHGEIQTSTLRLSSQLVDSSLQTVVYQLLPL
jgi:hypothetical protein